MCCRYFPINKWGDSHITWPAAVTSTNMFSNYYSRNYRLGSLWTKNTWTNVRMITVWSSAIKIAWHTTMINFLHIPTVWRKEWSIFKFDHVDFFSIRDTDLNHNGHKLIGYSRTFKNLWNEFNQFRVEDALHQFCRMSWVGPMEARLPLDNVYTTFKNVNLAQQIQQTFSHLFWTNHQTTTNSRNHRRSHPQPIRAGGCDG